MSDIEAMPGETVAVIDAGYMERDVVSLLTQRGYSVRLLTDNVYSVYQRLGEGGVDLTMVSLIEGREDDLDSLRLVVQGSSRVMYLGRTATGARYFNEMNVITSEAMRQGVSQLLLLSSAGTSRPWSLGTLLANADRLSLGWQRRAEDEVRASGISYVVVKAGAISPRRNEGWKGLLLRQGDLFGTLAAKKPGMNQRAAASVCVEGLIGLAARTITLEVVGEGTQMDCTGQGYDWASGFGPLMDDGPWNPPELDTLVAHDRATLSCAILSVLFPIVAATLVWTIASICKNKLVHPALNPNFPFVVLLILSTGGLLTLLMMCYWRKTLVRGCCCCVPLDYSITGWNRMMWRHPSGSPRPSSDHNVNQPFISVEEGQGVAIRC